MLFSGTQKRDADKMQWIHDLQYVPWDFWSHIVAHSRYVIMGDSGVPHEYQHMLDEGECLCGNPVFLKHMWWI